MNAFTIICNKCKSELNLKNIEHNDVNNITLKPDTCGQMMFLTCKMCGNEVQIFR